MPLPWVFIFFFLFLFFYSVILYFSVFASSKVSYEGYMKCSKILISW